MCVHVFSSHHFWHVKDVPQESSGVILLFFLLVLQGIEHASRKTDMQILISYRGGCTLSSENINNRVAIYSIF